FSSRRRHTRSKRDWSSDVCSSDLIPLQQIIRFHGFPVCLCKSIRLSLWPMAQADLIHNPVYGPFTGYMYALRLLQQQRLIHPDRSEERRVGRETIYGGIPVDWTEE